ncbi:hypothetical protein ACFXG1_20605 [Streptomyces sp. NPDC059248]|uniref:hypothetical protein n=1 Tax=Streptomyces sp. NPDC059248 TaxID=3346791 RepID=UPI0036B22ABE
MTNHTVSRGAARLRLAAVVAAPLLVLSAACRGGEGVRAHEGEEIASVADQPAPAGSARAGGGSPKPAASGRSAFYDAQLTYVRCMRTKGGVKDFPDPKLSGYLDWPKIDDVVDPKGRGEEYKGGRNAVCFPEMEAAMELAPKRDKQKDYESMLAHAKCMRDNGVSAFTNPTLSGGGVIPGGDPNPGNPVIDPKSPGYERSREACASKLLEGLDGMQ